MDPLPPSQVIGPSWRLHKSVSVLTVPTWFGMWIHRVRPSALGTPNRWSWDGSRTGQSRSAIGALGFFECPDFQPPEPPNPKDLRSIRSVFALEGYREVSPSSTGWT